jgi:hypothetical protein
MLKIVNHHTVRRGEFVSWSPDFFRRINFNLGNSLISETLLKLIPGASLHDTLQDVENILDPKKAALQLNNECNKSIFVLQDHVIFNSMPLSKSIDSEKILRCATFLENVRIPTLVVSLTMRKHLDSRIDHSYLLPESIELLKSLRNPFVSVGTRGFVTNNLLKEFGGIKVSAVGCPSFYARNTNRTREINLENVGTNGRFVNLSESSIHIAQGDDFGEPLLIKEVNRDGRLHATKEFKKRMSEFYDPDFLDKLYFPASTMDWRVATGKLSLVAGTRLHGAILALTLGIPVLTTASDVRAKETLEFMNIPHRDQLIKQNFSNMAIESKNDFQEFDYKYPEKLQKFLNWLNAG